MWRMLDLKFTAATSESQDRSASVLRAHITITELLTSLPRASSCKHPGQESPASSAPVDVCHPLDSALQDTDVGSPEHLTKALDQGPGSVKAERSTSQERWKANTYCLPLR